MRKLSTLVLMVMVALSVNAQKKVAYVVASGTTAETLNTTDPFWNSLKSNANYSTTSIELAAGIGSNEIITGADLIILTENPGSSAAGIQELNGIAKPMLMMKLFALSCQSGRWGWAIDDQAANRANEPAGETSVVIPSGKSSHAIFKGVTISGGSVKIINEAVSATKGMQTFPISGLKIAGGELNVLGTTPTDATRFSIAEVPVGASVGGFNDTYSAKSITKKMIMFGVHYPATILSLTNITADGLKILNNAVDYLAASGTSAEQSNFSNLVFTRNANFLNINMGKPQSAEISVYNIAGKMVSKMLVNGNTATIDLNNQPKGVYIVNVNGSEVRGTQKFMVR